MQYRKGFTLLETLIVMIIIGILAVLGVSQYFAVREKVLDKEAVSNLKIIQIAEKSYYMDTGSFYPPSGSTSDIPTINRDLKIFLNGRNWTYQVWSTGCARATRPGSGRSWFLAVNDSGGEPDLGSGCP